MKLSILKENMKGLDKVNGGASPLAGGTHILQMRVIINVTASRPSSASPMVALSRNQQGQPDSAQGIRGPTGLRDKAVCISRSPGEDSPDPDEADRGGLLWAV